MTKQEIQSLLNRIKFCIVHSVVVDYRSGQYVPFRIVLSYVKNEWLYSVEMHDCKRKDSSITVAVTDIDWPTTGGGFVCEV